MVLDHWAAAAGTWVAGVQSWTLRCSAEVRGDAYVQQYFLLRAAIHHQKP